MSISEYSTTPGSNTSINGINVAEGCSPAGLNNAIRQLMADIAEAAVGGIIPRGIIGEWFGSIATIPTGWALCDGTNGTPDLRGRFIVGAGGAYAVGITGGADSVTLTSAQMPQHSHSAGTLFAGTAGEHSHTIPSALSGTNVGGGGSLTMLSGGTATSSAGAHQHTIAGDTGAAGSSTSHENRPPYYALAYIMKL